MLAETMGRYKAVNTVGNTIGRVKDIYIDLNTWGIVGLEISPGALKRDFMLGTDEVVKFDETDRIIIVSDEFTRKDVPELASRETYPFEELKNHDVVDREEEKIGRIYDLEIPFEKLKMFRVWKILVKAGFTERRLRIPPSEIESIMDEIRLRRSKEDYREETEAE